MKKINVTELEFGKIVEEIPTYKFDCAQTHIYITNCCEEADAYLLNLVHTVPADKIRSYIVHWDDHTEDILTYFGE